MTIITYGKKKLEEAEGSREWESRPLECEVSEGTCDPPVPLSRIRTFFFCWRDGVAPWIPYGGVQDGTGAGPPGPNKLREEHAYKRGAIAHPGWPWYRRHAVIPTAFPWKWKGEAHDIATCKGSLAPGTTGLVATLRPQTYGVSGDIGRGRHPQVGHIPPSDQTRSSPPGRRTCAG